MPNNTHKSMTLLTLIILFSIFLLSCGKYEEFTQEAGLTTVHGYYSKDGKKQGKWTFYETVYRNNENKRNTRMIMNYKDNKPHGKQIEYYLNGKVKHEVEFKDGVPDGVFAKYDESGNMHMGTKYKNGEATEFLKLIEPQTKNTIDITIKDIKDNKTVEIAGKIREYDQTTGEITDLEFKSWLIPKADVEEAKFMLKPDFSTYTGTMTGYYKNGNIKDSSTVVKGIPDGTLLEYYENGKLKAEEPFKNGIIDGLWKEYYETGNLRGEWHYKNGKQHGSGKLNYENGKLKIESVWSEGMKNGIEKEYYEDGTLKSETTFLNDKIEGMRKLYHENGALKYEGNAKNGKEDGPVKEFYPDGKLKFETVFVNGVPEGFLRKYYPNGNLQHESNWSKGAEVGVRKEFSENGTPLKN